MEILTNPVLVAVVVLCVLCLLKLNVLMSLIISALVGALIGGISIPDAMKLLCSGFSRNAETALAYVLLGTFATAIATSGLADMFSRKLSKVMGRNGKIVLLIIAFIGCFSQNLVPVHIAFIPILIPPLLSLFNELKIDRRAAACSLCFSVKAPYIAIPFGFGSIFMGLISQNLTDNGWAAEVGDVAKVNWILALAMLIGLLLAIFVTYGRPREYKNVAADTSASDAVSDKFTAAHAVTIVAILVVVVVQIQWESLPLSTLAGLLVMFVGQAVKWNQIDDQFTSGIKIMGMVAIVMLVAGGFAEVIAATGAVDALVEAAIGVMGGNKIVAATMITLIGLLVTMGIGSSFSTIPILALLYVPLCQRMGFSLPATILLMSAAAAQSHLGHLRAHLHPLQYSLDAGRNHLLPVHLIPLIQTGASSLLWMTASAVP